MSIDISDENKMNKLINENTIEEVTKLNVEITRINNKMEEEIKKLKNEVNIFMNRTQNLSTNLT